jgi:hypothetical protein
MVESLKANANMGTLSDAHLLAARVEVSKSNRLPILLP